MTESYAETARFTLVFGFNSAEEVSYRLSGRWGRYRLGRRVFQSVACS